MGCNNKQQHPKQEDSNSHPIVTRILSGSIGSLATSLVVTPLEVIKVRMQTSTTTTTACCDYIVLNNGCCDCVVPRPAVSHNNNNLWPLARRIVATEGLGALYAGLRPTLLMSIPNTVLYYTTYDELQQRLPHHSLSPLCAGATARLLASTCTAPLELMRTQAAAATATATNAIQSSTSVFAGLTSTLWRDVPFSALYWYTLEKLRREWKKNDFQNDWLGDFVCGATAGSLAAACTTPMDVVKTRQQTALDVRPLLQQLQSLSLSTLWRGNLARLLKVAPACAIMLSTYEWGKRVLG